MSFEAKQSTVKVRIRAVVSTWKVEENSWKKGGRGKVFDSRRVMEAGSWRRNCI